MCSRASLDGHGEEHNILKAGLYVSSGILYFLGKGSTVTLPYSETGCIS